MSEKPVALRLAEQFDGGLQPNHPLYHCVGPTRDREAAAELRRQHAEIERLKADNERLQNTKHYEAPFGFVLNPDYLVPELKAENERLRGLVRHILGDRITPEAYLLFGKAWVDEAHAALRKEDV